ncbi:MAG: UDP-N-acetylmuramoyl-L-alanyl-D-glutamate--2,6-diaminopimelate ligase [Gemmatimonadetes bacterium]|nr:UDP-N-acetylmuramoyl-L-alanyl-D-glutamate--2,6-diaminopimelate ligase [Gemmatimonadota bacterium]
MTPPPDWEALITALERAGLLVSCSEGEPPVVGGLATDSRAVSSGDLFLALPGSVTDGHEFVRHAIGQGATAVIGERPMADGAVPEAIVGDARRAAQVVAELWYGRPAAGLALIGVTGTNGKTTTTMLLRHLLNARGTVGSIGTLGAVDGSGRPVTSTAGLLTTPGPVDLQATLASLAGSGVGQVVMETSSHSLDQGRLDGLQFAGALFTNLSRDHLDYHGTMEAYRDAKLRLAQYLELDGVAVVNHDDRAWDEVCGPRTVSFGEHTDADVRVSHIQLEATGSNFELSGTYGTRMVHLPLMGGFNVHNALAASAGALALGEDLDAVVRRLASAPQVPGRMERISDRPCPVLRDYAHTPDALERVLQTLRPLVAGRLIVVFGCGGDRDRGKRPIMGWIAAQWADLTVLTSDNPRTENAEAILDDVERGMGGVDHLRFVDRREAIAAAISAAASDDTVVLVGKGHETYQIIGTERVAFDEAVIVRELVGP